MAKKIIQQYQNIETSFRLFRYGSYLIWGVALVLFVIAAGKVFDFAKQSRSQIYVLDQGKSFVATSTNGAATIDLEVKDHVRTFHQLMFNLAPNAESIKANVERALNLADRSAYDYWQDVSETGYYERLISTNSVSSTIVDSVVVDVSVFPYRATTYAHQRLIRQSSMTVSSLVTTCEVIPVARSEKNPHGLLMEKFFVKEFVEVARRAR